MTKIIFYKDNQIDQEYTKDVSDIINEFYQTEESKLEAPLERLLLNFMSKEYGSFGMLKDEHWKALFEENTKYLKALKC